jgi:hypothetical protein
MLRFDGSRQWFDQDPGNLIRKAMRRCRMSEEIVIEDRRQDFAVWDDDTTKR